MSDVKLVIKLPEGIVEYIKNNGCLAVSYSDEIAQSIASGIPLPKRRERLIDNTEDEADERRKFAEWLINRIHRNSLQRVLEETKNFDVMGIDNILSIFEKEQDTANNTKVLPKQGEHKERNKNETYVR